MKNPTTTPISKAPLPHPQRVSMRTIADDLGVTKTTVSLALRGHTSISKKTRDKVQKRASELNYRPDPAIAAIAAQRWNCESPERNRVVAFLCHHRKNNIVQTGFLAGAKERAAELGYKLEPFYLDDYPSAKSITRVLYTRGIRGLIIPPIFNPHSTRAMNLDWDKFTSVCCGIGRVRPPLQTVTSDIFETTRRVWEVIAKAGYKRIGAALYCHNPIADDDWQRIGASSAAIRFLALEDSAKIPIHTADINDGGALMRWYEKYRPEIVIGFNNSIGEHLEENGVRIPKDVEFVSLTTPRDEKWSGVIQLHHEISRMSMDILNDEIRNNHWGLPTTPNITHIQPEWNRGSTVRTALKWTEDSGDSKGSDSKSSYTQELVPSC